MSIVFTTVLISILLFFSPQFQNVLSNVLSSGHQSSFQFFFTIFSTFVVQSFLDVKTKPQKQINETLSFLLCTKPSLLTLGPYTDVLKDRNSKYSTLSFCPRNKLSRYSLRSSSFLWVQSLFRSYISLVSLLVNFYVSLVV